MLPYIDPLTLIKYNKNTALGSGGRVTYTDEAQRRHKRAPLYIQRNKKRQRNKKMIEKYYIGEVKFYHKHAL